MNKIENLEKYKAIEAEAKEKGYRLSNCFFLPDTLKAKLDAGVLYSEHISDGIIIFEDNGSFYRCYYYFSDQAPEQSLNVDKDCVIEFPFNTEPNAKQLSQIDIISRLGFTLGRRSGLMKLEKEGLIPYEAQASAPCIETAALSDADEILALLNKSFNPLYAFLPDKAELSEIINNENAFVVHMDGRVAGALVSGMEKNAATIMQLAVYPEYRGRGIAKRLLQGYHNRYKDSTSHFKHWVDLDNTGAIKLYRSFGYDFTFRKANEYILLKKGDQ